MSGGHFDYQQFRIKDIADELKELIENESNDAVDEWDCPLKRSYSVATVCRFQEAAHHMRMAAIYLHRIDWLVSGDDGEETFHERLAEDLK